jgi:hypothetical protein
MQNKEFRNDDELKQEVDKFLTSRTRQFWKADIDSLRDRCQKVIDCDGDYFD